MLLEYGYTAAVGKAIAQVVDGIHVRCMEKFQERASDLPDQRLSNMIQIQIDTSDDVYIIWMTHHNVDRRLLLLHLLPKDASSTMAKLFGTIIVFSLLNGLTTTVRSQNNTIDIC